MAGQLIHVVRHAHAGDREAWQHDDDLRPLSDKGCGQAERLVAHLADQPTVLVSSPSLRCIATVLPLARTHRLALSTLDELYEGNSAAAMLTALAAMGGSPLVACTHGDLLADLLGLLIASGVELPSTRTEKGSTWTVELADGRLRTARYLPPP